MLKFPSDFPWGYAALIGSNGAVYMALFSYYARWRLLRSFHGIPRAAVYCFVYCPCSMMLAHILLIILWAMFYDDDDVQIVACFSWIFIVVQTVFLWWCISLNRAHHNNSLAHLTLDRGKLCETDAKFNRLASVC
ncbi:hypothetical protein BRADI_2g57945v3 [Brachypodium distachyon]|uniref:Uncharacterized protein n=1 Tax=Brachypodium distachyon TaxID=15368 RepID=A0A2K2DGJ7_BRADI|nr:hypothetical protein BRADI_2g57945v3 [Brachypodium distachyon]